MIYVHFLSGNFDFQAVKFFKAFFLRHFLENNLTFQNSSDIFSQMLLFSKLFVKPSFMETIVQVIYIRAVEIF